MRFEIDLIRNLLKERLRADQMAQLAGVTPDLVDQQSDEDILGTPEATIVMIVESYNSLKQLGIPEADILARIEKHRSMIGKGTLPAPLTLRSYIKYRVSLEYAHTAPVSDTSLDASLQEAVLFFQKHETPHDPFSQITTPVYPIQAAIEDFDSMVRSVAPRVAQKPQYGSVKAGWPNYLSFLEPLVSGRHFFFGAETIDYARSEFQKKITSVENEQATEKALYFGVMSISILAVAKRHDDYRMIDFEELSHLWLSQSVDPIESLKGYAFFELVNLNGLDTLLQAYLRLHVQPLVKDPKKMTDALSHFETQFFRGILLGQIVEYLILRPHYGQQNA